MKIFFNQIILFVIIYFFFQNHGYSQKTDTIIHENGNVLTGELKKMVYGVASWSMDGMGTISLEAVKIKTIRSTKLFEIKLKNGLIYFGSFESANVDKKVYFTMANQKDLIVIEDIVEIYPIKQNFWSRTKGNFSLGANFAKSSRVGTVSFSGNLDYRKKKSYFYLSWDNNNTFQADTLSATKSDVELGWQRRVNETWSAGFIIGAAQNRELGTKLRLNASALGLNNLVYNSWNRLYAGAGFTLARETPYDNTEVTNDMTGLVQIVWKVYKYTNPKLWVDANVNFLPYLTDPGRNRASVNLNPKVSIFSNNFKVGISFYYNYDSKPPSNAATDDFGANLQLTYSLH